MEAQANGRCRKREKVAWIKDETALRRGKISEETLKTQKTKIVIIGRHEKIIISDGKIIIDLEAKIKIW